MNYARREKTKITTNRQQIRDCIVGSSDDVHIVVRRLIMFLGFKSKLLGTQYLLDAILYRYENSNVMRVGMTNTSYGAVADKWQTTPSRVERAIRNTISNCHNNGSLSNFNELVQAQIIDVNYAPSNGEFVCSVVNWLQLEIQMGRDE